MGNVPEARVLSVHAVWVTIVCPYCGDVHEHKVMTRRDLFKRHRRAPQCGFVRNQDDRATGYWFQATEADE
jgi:predicted RNA-binding Zn-ribbon protein involved in translation (DUF1610 family)